jgi:hypothetical protein
MWDTILPGWGKVGAREQPETVANGAPPDPDENASESQITEQSQTAASARSNL